MWIQKQLHLKAKPRGFHLVTHEIVSQLPELPQIQTGLAHIFLQHTSASLTINENADADVRHDLENYFSRLVKENEAYFQHTIEGSDDMPAHIKNVLVGNSLSLPISRGELALGIWQGIYLCEHRNHAGKRCIIVTLHGE
jgi:secondary thiamine-phosphate synthase enzyme